MEAPFIMMPKGILSPAEISMMKFMQKLLNQMLTDFKNGKMVTANVDQDTATDIMIWIIESKPKGSEKAPGVIIAK